MTGSHRFVLDFLVEEVVQQQPEDIQRFLLHTSILDRLAGPLCDALLAHTSISGEATLEYLERANLFVVPLDYERRWYRYHHLFAYVLRGWLKAEQPDQVASLHQRASVWYEQHDLRPEAIRHAVTAEDYERAAALVKRTYLTMRRTRQEATLLTWTKALPEDDYYERGTAAALLGLAYWTRGTH